jgi:hypothetical protein
MNQLIDQAKMNVIIAQRLASLASQHARDAYDYYQLLLHTDLNNDVSKKGKKSRRKRK